MNWYQIKKHIYYTNDDYVRDIIALHLKRNALKAIYNYICQTSLVSMEKGFKGFTEGIEYDICNKIITLFLYKKPILRWYLNSRSLNTLYYTDLQLIISLFICIFLQVFVPLQYKTCRNIC